MIKFPSLENVELVIKKYARHVKTLKSGGYAEEIIKEAQAELVYLRGWQEGVSAIISNLPVNMAKESEAE
jgi:hypothetical protein